MPLWTQKTREGESASLCALTLCMRRVLLVPVRRNAFAGIILAFHEFLPTVLQ